MGIWRWTGSSYYDGIAHFRNLGEQKIQVGKDFKMGKFLLHYVFPSDLVIKKDFIG